MIFLNRHINASALFLIMVQICLSVSGPVYVTEFVGSSEARDSGIVCAHHDADSDHETQGGHEQITHCHELNAPCDTASGCVLVYSPDSFLLRSSDKGALLPGYGAPIDFPPENLV